MLKRSLAKLAAAGAALAFCAAAMAAPLPAVPNNGPINPALINDLNTLINQLNGYAGYTGVPQIVSFGQTCTASGATPQTCNGQRGVVTTNSLATAASASAAFVINDSFVTSGSSCNVNIGNTTSAGTPTIGSVVAAAGTLTVTIANVNTATALNNTVNLNFWCQ
jgi:hypothetical protein